MRLGDVFVPLIITAILVTAAIKKVNITEEFVTGAKENLATAVDILPSLILLMTAVGMFTASGVVEIIQQIIRPATDLIGFPDECVGLALIRPVSGSGAICTLETIFTTVSPDSFAGRTASVLMGSTETTFYTITVYFSAIKQKAAPIVFASACFADVTGFMLSAIAVRVLM